jgi:tellurite resistance protein
VVEPLENSSIEFAKTVGNLYYQHKDYTNLISKKLNYFLAYIRSQYYLDTTTINEKTAKDLAAKSGKPLTETIALVEYIKYLKNKSQNSESDIIELNKKITAFKN